VIHDETVSFLNNLMNTEITLATYMITVFTNYNACSSFFRSSYSHFEKYEHNSKAERAPQGLIWIDAL